MVKLCYGCMQQKNSSPVCEHCGYNENSENHPHQLPAGTILNGRYLIGKVLGQGGFGITYIGWDLLLEATVAIKEYYPRRFAARDCGSSLKVSCIGEKAEEPFQHNRDRFVAEAKIQARLSAVSEIVQIQRLFEENNTAYIIMEYVRGTDLKNYLQRLGRNLTLKETFSVMRPVIYALEKVHAAELVHRDISPDNIMIQRDGTVKILDFGAAYELGSETGREGGTASAQTVLKHGFAPIEQYNRDGHIGPWTDIYALCATMYYCLTGLVPNDAAERYLGNDNVDWSRIFGLTAAQISVLKRGLDVRTEKRLATIAELRYGLFEQVSDTYSELSAETSTEKTNAPDEVPDNTQDLVQEKNPSAETKDAAEPLDSGKTFWQRIKTPVAVIAAVLTIATAAVMVLRVKRPEDGIIEGPPIVSTEATTVPAQTDVLPTEQKETIPTEPVIEEPAWKKNVLMADATFQEDNQTFWNEEFTGFYYEIHDYFSKRPVFNTEIPRSKVTDVFFLDSVSSAPEIVYDVSAGQDGSVIAWTAKNRKGALNLYIAGEGGINGSEASYALFYGYKELESVNFNNCYFTDATQNMGNMFGYCKKLKSIDMNTLHTENVINMSGMFQGCEQLKTLDLSGMNTSSVENMSSMFSGCLGLQSLDISNFDTSNTMSMSYMFSGLESMAAIDIRHLDTSNVTNMKGMFSGCSNFDFTSLDLSNFDTSNVTDMSNMFYNCRWMTELDLRNFDTSKVTNMASMFSNCRRLISLDLSSFETSNVTNMQSMFEMCSMLPALKISHFDASKVIDLSYMFYKCGYLDVLDVTQWDVTNVKNNKNMFFGCDKLSLEQKQIGGKIVWSS